MANIPTTAEMIEKITEVAEGGGGGGAIGKTAAVKVNVTHMGNDGTMSVDLFGGTSGRNAYAVFGLVYDSAYDAYRAMNVNSNLVETEEFTRNYILIAPSINISFGNYSIITSVSGSATWDEGSTTVHVYGDCEIAVETETA